MKYRQKLIPVVNTPLYWKYCSSSELKKLVKEYYSKHLQGLIVENQSLNIKINLSSQGKNKNIKGSAIYLKKAGAIRILDKILKYAEYSNFGLRKDGDPKELLGYFNLKCKVLLNGVKENIYVSIMIYKNGKIFYSIEVNQIK